MNRPQRRPTASIQKPPNGTREYANSIITQQHAAASGQARNVEMRCRAIPSRPKKSDSKAMRINTIQTPST